MTPTQNELVKHYETSPEVLLAFEKWLSDNSLVKLRGMFEAFLAGYKSAE